MKETELKPCPFCGNVAYDHIKYEIHSHKQRHIDYAKIPMGKNDIGAKTIGEYFEKLLLTLWDEQEDFSGKRPFGNGGWEYDVYASLISAGVVDGSLDEEGYVVDVTYSSANNIICEMIKQIFAVQADVVPKSELDDLQAMLDATIAGQETLQKALADAKSEVAREIFEDIEKVLDEYAIILDGEIGFYSRMNYLKEKYTKQCPDCKHFVGCECFDGKTCDEYEEGEK